MTKLDSVLRKEIVKNLHAAIDNEMTDNDKVLSHSDELHLFVSPSGLEFIG